MVILEMAPKHLIIRSTSISVITMEVVLALHKQMGRWQMSAIPQYMVRIRYLAVVPVMVLHDADSVM